MWETDELGEAPEAEGVTYSMATVKLGVVWRQNKARRKLGYYKEASGDGPSVQVSRSQANTQKCLWYRDSGTKGTAARAPSCLRVTQTQQAKKKPCALLFKFWTRAEHRGIEGVDSL